MAVSGMKSVQGLPSTTNRDPGWPEFPGLEAAGRLEVGSRGNPEEPQGLMTVNGRGCVCLEEKPKYISELVKLLRPFRE